MRRISPTWTPLNPSLRHTLGNKLGYADVLTQKFWMHRCKATRGRMDRGKSEINRKLRRLWNPTLQHVIKIYRHTGGSPWSNQRSQTCNRAHLAVLLTHALGSTQNRTVSQRARTRPKEQKATNACSWVSPNGWTGLIVLFLKKDAVLRFCID